ncbi:ComF family protein [Tepidibacillus fermentans]|uniref:Competence protein ComFC n=1 Tax=Tepidibacillus fermentans TaxID=1281767 RepID=A0A4R3KJ78_9BACI|nr:ComF family protein [Tepidibacillus fermentans]TCS83325.1 competence protein ComFC [Tepidibacillus fermentans]
MELKVLLRSFFHDLLFPEQKCLLCEKPIVGYAKDVSHHLSQMKYVCMTCKEQIEIPTSPYCQHCHKPLDHTTSTKINQSSDPLLCLDCQYQPNHAIVMNRSAVLYNTFLKEAIALYKYRGKESLSIVFSRLLKIAYDRYYQDLSIDYITFVPLHPNRLQERSFNQAEQLSLRLSRMVGIPIIDSIERVKETHKQSKSGKWERINEMKDAFQVKREVIEQIEGKTLLIVDDIYTTGATINECAKELTHSGASMVYSLTLSRA